MNKFLGEIRGTRANDFSKIQGRFYTRISLSSANTDEVIQFRLLEKTGDAQRALEDLYHEKGEILKNQISFTQSATLENYKDTDNFVKNYPFAPYQFLLLQKVFESIRKAGATGKHPAMGERSMLDAFQSAAKNIAERNVGAMVPLYEFYPAIESFLDTIVKRTIDQAKDNPGLEAFDVQLLRSLFLIRYVDIIKPNIDNLVTLSIEEVDADRFSIKHKIEESLQRLEKETLISRNGDLYFFLTNEECDVSKEIKNVDISGSEETKLISELIFEDVLKGDNKRTA